MHKFTSTCSIFRINSNKYLLKVLPSGEMKKFMHADGLAHEHVFDFKIKDPAIINKILITGVFDGKWFRILDSTNSRISTRTQNRLHACACQEYKIVANCNIDFVQECKKILQNE